MEKSIKKIGVLTSGGDCAGLNAVLSSVVRRAHTLGWETHGLLNGTECLLERPARAKKLEPNTLPPSLIRQGGTFLGTTNRGNPFAYPMLDGSTRDRTPDLIEGWEQLGLDALIGIGGDGSQAILKRLTQQGNIRYIGVPKTIDNDIGATEVSVGYDTAMSVATQALDMLQPTAASHSRIMVLEVMGRDAGHIALTAGIAGGADVILIPEIAWTLEGVTRKIQKIRDSGRNFVLVIVAEATPLPSAQVRQVTYPGGAVRYGGIGAEVAEMLAEATGAETRMTVLGHVQRGAAPTPRDRLMATAMGTHAVNLLATGHHDEMVIWTNRRVSSVSIDEAVKEPSLVDREGTMVQTARGIGISFGDDET